ncbi:MAG: nitroreductase family protein [Chloroflexota bacterium]
MSFMKLVQDRYSVRSYTGQPVEDEKLQRILEAARLAPTAANRQAFRIYVITTEGNQEALSQVYPRPWFIQAPLVICACGIPDENWVRRDGKNYNYVDVAIAMDHLILAAADEGLGTCWVAAFDIQEARKLLRLPPEIEPVAFTPLGYAADEPRLKKRKALDELVEYVD